MAGEQQQQDTSTGSGDTGGQQQQQQQVTWYGTPEPEMLGYMQTRGYDKMTPDKAALAAINAHREAEKFLGAPKEQLIRVPAVGDAAGWKEVWQRLGTPADKKEYDFSMFKKADGTAQLDAAEDEALRDLAHTLDLSKEKATLLVQKLGGLAEKGEQMEAAASAGEKAAQLGTLKNNWGQHEATNRVVAENAAVKLGLDPALLKTDGGEIKIPYAQAMSMLHKLGQQMGEDGFVRGGIGSNAPMTLEQATDKMDLLSKDSVWYGRYMNGDALAVKEFNDLTNIIAQGRPKY